MPTVKAVISSSDFSLLYAADEAINEANKNIDQLFAQKYPNGFDASYVSYPKDNDKELAIINYTSGTTSAPKGVMLRYECLSANVEFGQNRKSLRLELRMSRMFCSAMVRTFSLGMRPSSRAIIS